MSLNKVMLLGNVGQEPQIRTTQNGKKIASFSLATKEGYKNKQTGEYIEQTQWHKVVIYNENIANIVEKYVSKGSKLFIEGSLQTRKWTDNSGVDKYITEIVLQGFNNKLELLDGKNNQSENMEPQVESEPQGIEDDVPF